MATYAQIKDWVYDTYSVQIYHPCYIAHAKELSGLPVRRAWNRRSNQRMIPCPPDMLPKIQAAFRHFGLMPS